MVGVVTIQDIGAILMAVGVIGLMVSFALWSSWSSRWSAERRRTAADDRVVDLRDAAARRAAAGDGGDEVRGEDDDDIGRAA